MSKPDDIPKDVWDAARNVEIVGDFSFDGQSSGVREQQETAENIARSIMAAKAEEREACAQVVLGYPPEGFNAALYDRTMRYDDHDSFWKFEGDTGNWAALMGEVLKPYAAAIRARGTDEQR